MNKKLILTLTTIFTPICLPSCGEEDLGYKAPTRTLNFYALNDFHGAFYMMMKQNRPVYQKLAIF